LILNQGGLPIIVVVYALYGDRLRRYFDALITIQILK